MNASEVLIKAAEVLETKGWTKGSYVGPFGRHCAVGAIWVACGYKKGKVDSMDGQLSRIAQDCLASFIRDKYNFIMSIEGWNDGYAKNGKEVIETMHAAAKACES